MWYNKPSKVKESVMTRTKKLYTTAAVAFVAINLIAFLIFFIPNYVLEIDIGEFEYVRIFLTKLIEFALPPIAAVLIYVGGSCEGWERAIKRSAGIASTRAVYLLPYYYLYHIAYGYDSIESIVLSILVSLFGIALLFGQIILLYEALRVTTRKVVKKALIDDLPPMYKKEMPKDIKNMLDKKAEDSLREIPEKPGIFDFSAPVTVGIFSAVFTQFMISFIYELVDTIEYLVSFAGYYRLGEIIYITVSFLYILLELLIVHVVCYALKNKLCKKVPEKEKESERVA